MLWIMHHALYSSENCCLQQRPKQIQTECGLPHRILPPRVFKCECLGYDNVWTAEGGGRSNKAASCRAEGIQHITVAGDAGVGASSTQAAVGSMLSATGWVLRTETWHCPQHSREESAGPEVSPCAACPCDLRQQLALLPLQQHDASLESAANARNGIGWANRNTTSANANQRAIREGITPSIRLNGAKTSVRMLLESFHNPSARPGRFGWGANHNGSWNIAQLHLIGVSMRCTSCVPCWQSRQHGIVHKSVPRYASTSYGRRRADRRA